MSNQKLSDIANFYKNRNIFITGATGFIGKVLVEKLLRSCKAVGKIYLLLRTKKNKEPQQRLEELMNSKIFERVKNEYPEAMAKLVPICGDIFLPELGISTSDINILTKEVSVVFHCAASIRFDDPLKLAVNINALGTKKLVEICRQMHQLEAFIHLSTAYSNCDRDTIDEIIYPSPVEVEKIIGAILWMDKDLMEVMTPHLIKGRPNTYTYTKALAEYLLEEESGNFPLAIVRPPIVTCSWKEPYPGWVDNLNGMTGVVAAMGNGLVQSMMADTSKNVDLIPVDIVVNLIISVAWYIAKNRPNKVIIYNCLAGKTNKLTWGDAQNIMGPIANRFPFLKTYQYPNAQLTSSKLQHLLLKVFYSFLPAYFADFVAGLTGQKPKLVAMYKNIYQRMEGIQYFTCREWTFHNSNVFKLHQKLSTADEMEFNFDVSSLQWPNYFEDYFLGIRKFLFKEDLSSLPEARKVLKKHYILKIAVQSLVMILMGGTLIRILL